MSTAECISVGDPFPSVWTQLCCGDTFSALSPSVKSLLCNSGVVSKGWSESKTSTAPTPKNKSNNEAASGLNAHPSCTTESSSDDICGRDSYRSLFTTDGLIDIELCLRVLPKSRGSYDAQYYVEAVKCLAPAFLLCLETWTDRTADHFSQTCHDHLLWTKNPQLFLECFKLLSQEEDASDILALLLICGGLEKALGNLYLLQGSQCPSLLKDLLTTHELCKLLGKEAIQILHILLGPPISMNIRNVAWHGFLHEQELPRRYIYFLLIFTASIGKLLSDKGINHSSIIDRSYVPLTEVEKIKEHFQGFVDVEESQLAEWEDVICKGWLVNGGNKNLFKSVFHWYRHKRYGWSVTQLLPLLEHGLRRLFVLVNKCSERLVTAESTTLFTTFEEILDGNLPDGKPNALIQLLGEPAMDLLHDLLIYSHGPRARDKLGHGESDFSAVPQSLSSLLLCLTVFVTVRLRPGEHSSDVVSAIENYMSIFHPIGVLKRKILNVASEAGKLVDGLHTAPDLSAWKVETGFEVFTKENSVYDQSVGKLHPILMNLGLPWQNSTNFKSLRDKVLVPFSELEAELCSLLSFRIGTLHRWQREQNAVSKNQVSESQIVGLLTRILQETESSLLQTRDAVDTRQQLLVSQQLRSRQRDNTKRLLMFLPCLSVHTNFMIFLCSWIFCHLDNYKELEDSACLSLQRFLKQTLQVCENIRTFTGAEVNKWTQAASLINAFFDTASSFFVPFSQK